MISLASRLRPFAWIAGAAPTALAVCMFAAPGHAQPLDYTTLDLGTSGTFLTGIRGDTIVGNYVIPGTSDTGGLLYNLTSGLWTPFPIATANGANFPDATGSSPYGPHFGSQSGILRVVGSYMTVDSAPYDLSYLYDGAGAPGAQLTTLIYPTTGSDPTLFTIAHSNFGDQVVGNYDTQLLTGNAFVYTISTGTYATQNHPDAVSTTAYGVWGDKIAGGFVGTGVGVPQQGFIYDQSTDTWTDYNHPGAISTHFEGITGGGAANTYNLVANWFDIDGDEHAAVLHIAADGTETWTALDVPGATLTSANSIYGNQAIGIYVDGTGTHGYVVSIPGIYNPITNSATLNINTPNVPVLSGIEGDDIVNSGVINTTGANNAGIQSDTYGVVSNSGEIEVTGLGSAGVKMNGAYGTLLNGGTITAAPGADAIRTDPAAIGSAAVNLGTIDGRVLFEAGALARFENSGTLGISTPGAGTMHLFGGTFVQTADGILALRVGASSNDALQIDGVARLAGGMVSVFQTGDVRRSYTLLTASDGLTGTFGTLTTDGLPNFLSASLAYSPEEVMLMLASGMAQEAGLSRNQIAVASALDAAFNANGSLPGGLGGLFGLTPEQLGDALNALSGEVHASTQTALIDEARSVGSALFGRLRAADYADTGGVTEPLGYGGPVTTEIAALAAIETDLPANALAYGESGGARAPFARDGDLTFWAEGLGAWSRSDDDGNAAEMERRTGGVFVGADRIFADAFRMGIATGYSHAEVDVSDRSSSADIDTFHIAGYAGTAFGQWRLRAGAAFALHDIETSRAIVFPGLSDTAEASYQGWTGQTLGEIGYAMTLNNVAVEPFAGLAWLHQDTDSFVESGGVAALSGSGGTADIGYSSLGFRLATRIRLDNGMVMVPRASFAWQHAFGDVTPATELTFQSTGTAFDVRGTPLAEDAALVEAGLDLSLTPRMVLGASYAGQIAGDAQDHIIAGRFTWRF